MYYAGDVRQQATIMGPNTLQLPFEAQLCWWPTWTVETYIKCLSNERHEYLMFPIAVYTSCPSEIVHMLHRWQ